MRPSFEELDRVLHSVKSYPEYKLQCTIHNFEHINWNVQEFGQPDEREFFEVLMLTYAMNGFNLKKMSKPDFREGE